MEQQLYELLHQCTVRISVSGKTGHGTGFFVAPRLILTCAHVLKAAQSDTSPIEVFWNGQFYSAQLSKLQQDPDLALLQVNLGDHPCVYLHEEAIPFDALYSYGYPDDHLDGDPATFTLEGKAGDQGEQLKFKAGQVRPGMSGAPLLNVRTGHICGIVQLTRDRDDDLGGRAIPITTMFRNFPEVVAQQQRFHQQDGRWTNCLWETVARTKYLESMIRQYSSVTLPIGPAQGFSLQAIFQPLKLRRDPLAAEDLVREERRALLGELRYSDEDPRRAFPGSRRSGGQVRQPSPVVIAENADDAFRKSSKRSMVILGGPGTGKTTLLAYLAGDRAQKALVDPTAPLPVFILLSDLARSGKTLKEYLLSVVQDMMVDERYAQMLWKAIEQGQVFVCLDSLDELAPKLRPEKIRLINEWASSTNSTFIIGSRFTDYKGGQLRSEQFTEWELQPMTPALRQELAKRLLPELYRLMSPNEIPAESSTFISALERHEQAAAWGENPLLFSLATVVFVREGTLPTSRVMLYQQVIDAVLETREPHRSRREMLRSVLACLALELFQEKGRAFTHSDLLRFLRIVRKRQDEQWNTEEIAQRIIDSGVLEVVAHNTYGFRHQTFQEYLAALELAHRLTSKDRPTQEEAWDLAWSKRTYSRWTEVLRLLTGVLAHGYDRGGPQRAIQWLHRLIEQHTNPGGDPGDLGLTLALKSLNECEKTGTLWKEIGGVKLEKGVGEIWVEALWDAVQREHKMRQERLLSMTHEICQLNQSVVNMVRERLEHDFINKGFKAYKIALRAFGRLREHADIEYLVKALGDKDSKLRDVAFQALKELGDHLPKEKLIAAMTSFNPRVRAAAVEMLGEAKNQSLVSLLTSALNNGDIDVYAAAIEAVGKLGDHAPIDHLMATLDHPHPVVRRAAARAQGNLGTRASVDKLMERLRDADTLVRVAAIEALGKLEVDNLVDRLKVVLTDKDELVRATAIEMLGERTPLERLIEEVSKQHFFTNYFAFNAAAQVLGRLGERAPVDRMITALGNENQREMHQLIRALGELQTLAPTDTLVAALYSRERETCLAAAEVLGKLRMYAPVEQLIASLESKDGFARETAVQILGKVGRYAPLDQIFAALNDEDSKVRCKAIGALEDLVEGIPAEPLIALLDDPDDQVCSQALWMLAQMKERIPIELLTNELFIAALKDDFWRTSSAAILCLEAIGERIPLNLLTTLINHNDRNIREAVIGALGCFAPTEQLIAALQDASPGVRSAALYALRFQEERIPLELLVHALHDEHEAVRKAAIHAIGSLGEGALVEQLVDALYDEHEAVRKAATQALMQLGEWELLHELFSNYDYEEDGDTYVPHLTVVESLERLDARMPVEWLVAGLESEYGMTRAWSIEALGERVPLNKLINALDDDYAAVRRAALEILGTRISMDRLIAFLDDENSSIRKLAIQALGIRTPMNKLIDALGNSDWCVSRVAAEMLSKFAGRLPEDQLLVATQGSSTRMRAGAIQVLGARIPSEALVAALGDSDRDVRFAAVEVLTQAYPEVLLSILPEISTVLSSKGTNKILASITQGFIADIIGNMESVSPILIDKLTQLLNWDYWEVKMKALQALGKIHRNIPDAAIDRLLELREEAPSEAVRNAADDALAEILSIDTGVEDD